MRGPFEWVPAQLSELLRVAAPDAASLALREVESELDDAKRASHKEKAARVAALFARLGRPWSERSSLGRSRGRSGRGASVAS